MTVGVFPPPSPVTGTPNGYTTLFSGTLSSAQVNLSSIDGSYRRLVLVINNPSVNSGTPLGLRINAHTGGSSYTGIIRQSTTTAMVTTGSDSQWALALGNNIATSTPITDQWICTFDEYASNNVIKRMQLTAWHNNGAGGYEGFYVCNGVSAAITSMQIRTYNGSSTFSGGTYTLYGVK